ncbi:MAG: Z1 domain-containing protein [Fibrobacter sp.]|nr:Z1 domain-containing protein [Fibrobacter sp.]
MSVDHEKINNLMLSAMSLIKASNWDEKKITEDEIEKVIERSSLYLGYSLSPEEFDAFKNELQYRYQVFCAPGQSILNDYEQEEWYSECKSELDHKFWNRYKTFLIETKHFSPNVVSTLGDETLDEKIMNCIGNPKSEKGFLKRGLIIGDVQSGKTSTYIGLMCKAADAGYKVFILLTGTTESLRRQTQERVEEGFIGVDMSNKGNIRIGVGLDGKPLFAKAMTSRERDFVGGVNTIADSLAGNNQAVVFVIKKNTTALSNLTDWLIELNLDPRTNKIDQPMLIIDDEADNASINTSKNKEDPTVINKKIRKLASVFTKSNYVGFTATPFANVFIDPVTTKEMKTQDLFPEDFIVALQSPNNYVGATRTFALGGEFRNQLVYIKDAGETEKDGKPFYYKHKKDWRGPLPESLTDSIYAFYIANALRDLRGDEKEHRSMLVNISRFIPVQKYIKEEIEKIHDSAYRAIKFNLKGCASDDADPVLRRIREVFKRYYPSVEFSWKEIAKKLFQSIEDIKIRVVNSSKQSEKLIYPKNESLRVIAIGGLALSRGLTLEGLIVSYFYRNTNTYDVLMQMGRWFGYRKNYEDLFRIWIAERSADWYAEIAEATEQLKLDMNDMCERKCKPIDFGIRVRNDSEDLKITSYNKMRNTTDFYEVDDFFGKCVETPYLEADAKKLIKNYCAVENLINKCKKNGLDLNQVTSQLSGCGKHYIIQDVPKDYIKSFMRNITVSKSCRYFDPNQIVQFIDDNYDDIVDDFDVAFMEGRDSSSTTIVDGKKIQLVQRGGCGFDAAGKKIKIGERGKLSGPGDGKIGIVDYNDKTAEDIVDELKTVYSESPDAVKSLPTEAYFKYVKDRKPMLMIYLLNLEMKSEDASFNRIKKEMGEIPFTAFYVGFPKIDDTSSKRRAVKHKVNKTYNYYDRHSNEELEEVE